MPKDIFFSIRGNAQEPLSVETTAEHTSELLHETQRQERFVAENGYDDEALERENLILRNRLADNSLLPDMEESLQERGKAIDMTRIVRNDSILLYHDSRGFEDSPLMDRIKDGIKTLDSALRKPMTEGSRGLCRTYQAAIDLLEEYEATKNPHFPAGKRRKKKVIALKRALTEERNRFLTLLQERRPGENEPEEALIPLDVLEGKYINGEQIGGPLENLAMRKRDILLMKRSNGAEDSPDMIAVKNTYSRLTELLTGPVDEGEAFDEKKAGIQEAYRNVCSACARYLTTHDPKTDEGKERLSAVEKLMERCRYEYEYILAQAIKQREDNPQRASWEGAYQAVSLMADEGLKAKANIEKLLGKKPTVHSVLSVVSAFSELNQTDLYKYDVMSTKVMTEWIESHMDKEMVDQFITERFHTMHTMRKRYLEFADNPVPQEFLKNPGDDPMDKNLRKTFAALMMYADPAFESMKALNSFSMLLAGDINKERSLFAREEESLGEYYVNRRNARIEAMSQGDRGEINRMDAAVSEVMNANYSLLNTDAVNRFKALSDARGLSKSKSDLKGIISTGYLGYEKDEEKKADKQLQEYKDNMVLNEAETILAKARAEGMDIAPLTEKQKEELKKAGLQGIADEISEGLHILSTTVTKQGPEAVEVLLREKDSLYTKVAAAAIKSRSRVSAFGETVAEYELRRFAYETAMRMGGKEELKSYSEKMYISSLSSGARGLTRLVKEKEPEVEAWKDKDEKLKLGASVLGGICKNLESMYRLHGKALS
ncbi:MAG: hypothetical protein J6N76_05105, partial [Lachnospiraceae bacterium]|nr:hypothetical protein [Lachnospiraceae bacterium]